MIPYQELKHRK